MGNFYVFVFLFTFSVVLEDMHFLPFWYISSVLKDGGLLVEVLVFLSNLGSRAMGCM